MNIGGPVCLSLKTWSFIASLFSSAQLLTNSRTPGQNKESPLTTVPFIWVVLTVVVMVTDPTVGNAAQIFTTKLALCAHTWSWGENRRAEISQCGIKHVQIFILLMLNLDTHKSEGVKSPNVNSQQVRHISQTCNNTSRFQMLSIIFLHIMT